MGWADGTRNPPQRQALSLHATFMNPLIIFISLLTLIGCNNSNLQTNNAARKSIHIPDTTNNLYAKLFDYPYYLQKVALVRQLNLDRLETDTSNSEIRIWTIGANYNPQTIFFIKRTNDFWTISKLNYYLDHNEIKTKGDSMSTQKKSEKTVSSNEFSLLWTEKIWQLPSQSEMKNGSSYGCVDGYALLIEMNDKLRYKFSCYVCPDLHVLKDSTFKTVVDFKQKVGELSARNNLADK